MNRIFIEKLKTIISTPKKVCIVSHKNPDGDALGSSLAMYHYLIGKGHHVSVIMPNHYPDFLSWMPSQEKIIRFDVDVDKASSLIQKADTIFTLDFNALSRSGDMHSVLEKTKASLVMIDHHEHPKNYTEYMYSDSSMGSTSQMIYHVIEKMKDIGRITPEIATCIYLGIMTDSGGFRFPRTTSTTHRVVAHLIEKGIDNTQIYSQVFEQKSISNIRLLGFALSNIKALESHNTVYFALSKEDLERNNYKKGDTEGIVNFGLSIKGVKFAALFTESLQGTYVKISFRSKGGFKANDFSKRYFEGGGHTNAAGGRCEGSLQHATSRFESCLDFYKKDCIDE